MIKITGLFIYPVKSLGGIALDSATLYERGFEHDREWMLVDDNNRFVSQREIAAMALVKTALNVEGGSLELTLPSGKKLAVPLARPASTPAEAKIVEVKVWNDQCQALVESAEVNAALSEFLGQSVRLVRMLHDFKRKVDPDYAPDWQDIVSFADGFPILIISEESLQDLNNKLEYPVLMNRFRPNIVTAGGEPFGEDDWGKIKVRDVEMHLVKPCARCVITTVDQEDGIAGKEPLRTLANYRKQNGKIMFGQNAVFRGGGTLKVGDAVSLV